MSEELKDEPKYLEFGNMKVRQPTYADLWDAFVSGAREARINEAATDRDFNRAADAYCKLFNIDGTTRADSELAQLRAEVAELREERAVLKSQVENADVNLEQVKLNARSQWRTKLESAEARIAELELSLAIVGDMAVADWNDEAVGIVDAQVKEPLRYKDQLRSMFAARDKCVELQADNLRLHRLLAQFTGNA